MSVSKGEVIALAKALSRSADVDLLIDLAGELSWAQAVQLVQRGKAARWLPPGTQLTTPWTATGGTTYDAVWDVVHHGEDGGMYLKWHYAVPDGIVYDEPEAIYYAGEDGLAAGDYHIKIGVAYGDGWVKDAYIGFTLTGALDPGDQIVIDCNKSNATNPGNSRTGKVYAAGSTTEKETFTTNTGSTGTLLGTIGATSAHNPEGNLNAPSRVVYGYNRWAQSAIRQWLNSEEDAGSWWSAQNGWDRPPAIAGTMKGFLSGFESDMLEAIRPVPVVTAIHTAEASPDTYETTQDRIFLPSLQEMYITPQLADVEGVDWDYYKELNKAAGRTAKWATGSTYPELITYNLSLKTSAVHVWLRSA